VSNPYAGGPDEPGRIRAGLVVVGIIVGFVVTIVWIFLVFLLAISQENAPGFPNWLGVVLLFLPLPVAVVLLCLRRTRQAAAGLVMGLAIGAIVFAGVCGSLIAAVNGGA
jgi:hypothetical protein